MGMIIYTLEGIPIGQRWAAGVWCWKCKIELEAEDDNKDYFWVCPQCDQKGRKGTLDYKPSLRELGWDKGITREHFGVDGASRFVWQIGELGLGKTVEEVKNKLEKIKYVKTEYDEKWSMEQFWDMFKDIIVEEKQERKFIRRSIRTNN